MTRLSFVGVSRWYDAATPILNDVSFEIEAGEFFVLVGPSGSGKSTLLRIIAGLDTASKGSIFFDGQIMNEVEARERDVGMVFQNYALYPHLTVEQNLAFPLAVRKQDRAFIRQRVVDVADMLGIGPLLHRKPRQLSGGQRQRVAVGRAIVRKPRVFLFDEPLSNLDAGLRMEMRTELRLLQRTTGITTVYVTHDQTEAMTMADRMAILNLGSPEQVDTPRMIYDNPDTLFVATFCGSPPMNILQIETGFVGFRPESVVVGSSNTLNIRCGIENIEYLGTEYLSYLRHQGKLLVMRSHAPVGDIGATLEFSVADANLHYFDSQGKRQQ